jgi:uncharacterized protein
MKRGGALVAIMFLLPIFVLAYYNPGKPTGFVNDFSGTLNGQQISDLNIKLDNFEKESSNELAVVLIKNLDSDTIENFAEKLFKDWGIGKDKQDNGVLLLIAMEDRQMRIEVGYGLEGALTDAQSYSIIQNDLVPFFRSGDYYGGINKTVDNIILATKGEYSPSPKKFSNLNLSFDFVFFLFFVLIWLVGILGRSKSWWAGGVLGAVIGLILWSLIATIALTLFGLLIDFLASRSYKKAKESGTSLPWWFGGGGSSGGGFGGGFGGFGGGSSGGGGASGRW